jgi:hypothetical protein
MTLAKHEYMSDVWKDGIFSEPPPLKALLDPSNSSRQITKLSSAPVELAPFAVPRFVL